MRVDPSRSMSNPPQNTWASRIAQIGQQAKPVSLSVRTDDEQEVKKQAEQLTSAIVHKRIDAVPEVTYPRLRLTTNNATGPDLGRMKTFGKEMANTYHGMRAAWKDFRQSLTQYAPSLAGKDFGFTVDTHGALMATENKDVLTTSEKEGLSRLMNESRSLKDSASRYAQASTDYTSEKTWGIRNGGSVFDVTMENFNRVFDLGLMIDKDPEPNGKPKDSSLWQYTWLGQLQNKAERVASSYREWDIS